jgi:23S rRNA (cytidine1920-2'-O)/16S rRNA (cytidine1409-2'-O)-methyltransferase
VKRADKVLVELGLFESRKKAQVAIEKGLVSFVRNGETIPILKVSQELEPQANDQWTIEANLELEYVSRSGAKLHEALEFWKISPKGFSVLDIGQSTGGFTECLLRHGAEFVVGLDVGKDQLHPRLREHPQVLSIEKINARNVIPDETLEAIQIAVESWPFDMIVCDVSFISAQTVMLAQWDLLKAGGQALVLFKPQYEVGRGVHGKKGTIPDEEGLRVLEKTVKILSEQGKKVRGTLKSKVRGEDGNQEYFIYLHKS